MQAVEVGELRVLPEGGIFSGNVYGFLAARRVSELAKPQLPQPWAIRKLGHMFAARSLAESKDLVSVQRMLGRANITTSTAYVQSSEEELKGIVNAIAGRAFEYRTG